MTKRSALQLVLCVCVISSLRLISGCGSNSPGTSQPAAPTGALAVSITDQPASVTVPADEFATFSVTAIGTGPLAYQWTENGVPVAGATSASYTSTSASFGDSGEKFAVTVSNSVNSVTSSQAVLTVGARSPKSGDLRFQQVDALSMANQGTGAIASIGFFDNSSGFYTEATGSPLEMSDGGCYPEVAYDCGWSVLVNALPAGQTGLTYTYYGGDYPSLASDFSGSGNSISAEMISPNSVITSLDLQPANEAYAASWLTSNQTNGFDLKREVVAPDAVATTVAADAAQSRVVTAVSIDRSIGQVDLLSYGWQADTTTIYDTDVLLAGPTIPEIETAANAMAQQGYILTAFGGNFHDGFLLIGTKVHGDTLPRPIQIYDQNSAPTTSSQINDYAEVAWAAHYPNPGAMQYVFVYEK